MNLESTLTLWEYILAGIIQGQIIDSFAEIRLGDDELKKDPNTEPLDLTLNFKLKLTVNITLVECCSHYIRNRILDRIRNRIRILNHTLNMKDELENCLLCSLSRFVLDSNQVPFDHHVKVY